MGITSLFREVYEEDDRLTIRSLTGFNFAGIVLLVSGLIVASLCLPVAFIVSGSDQTDLAFIGFAGIVAAALGVALRLVGPKKSVDFHDQMVIENGISRPFSALTFVAMTEQVQVTRTQNGELRVANFTVTLAFGKLESSELRERLDDIRSLALDDDFVAGDSLLDEAMVGEFFVAHELEGLHLFESADYPTLFRTSHRLAKDAGVPLLNLTGSAFSVASGAELEVPFGERVVERNAGVTADDARIESVAKPDGFEISWRYDLSFALIMSLGIGLGSTALGFVLMSDASGGTPIAGMVLAAVFGVMTVLVVGWLVRLNGTHRILIDDRSIRYERPFGAGKFVMLEDLLDIYVRPNVSDGMSALLLLSDRQVVTAQGKLPDLQAVDREIRHHLTALNSMM